MEQTKDQKLLGTVKLSVRSLVEFILRSGDLGTGIGVSTLESMQLGAKIHRMIQKQGGPDYQAEVRLTDTTALTVEPLHHDRDVFALTVEPLQDDHEVPVQTTEAMVSDHDTPVQTAEPLASDHDTLAQTAEPGRTIDPEHFFPEGGILLLTVDGRADGVYTEKDESSGERLTFVEEIKGVYWELESIQEPEPVHLAQARCYAHFLCKAKHLSRIGIRMTYCHMPTERILHLDRVEEADFLSDWYQALIREYSKWALFQISWRHRRDASLQSLAFPFPYREGQQKLTHDVYRTILREKRLFLQAPTGVGKTMAVLYPAVRALGEGLTSLVFYLTAKTSTRMVAEEALTILKEKGALLLAVSLTAKERICPMEEVDCDPRHCPRAKGYYDRVNEALYALLIQEASISRTTILSYGEKYEVCPYELSLDAALFADVVIGDYNHAFDPTASLKRFFSQEKRDYVLLVDEAHNLVERGREMYSAVLRKGQFLSVKRKVKGRHAKLEKALSACNRQLLSLKRQCPSFQELSEVGALPQALQRFLSVCEELFLEKNQIAEDLEVKSLYFDVKAFSTLYAGMEKTDTLYGDYEGEESFFVKLQCLDPSRHLAQVADTVRSTVFFSATLLPVSYYREQLGGRDEDYAVYAPSPFPREHRLVLAAGDVSSRYERRGPQLYQRIAAYIRQFVAGKEGNYLVFFPSYQMMREVAVYLQDGPYRLLQQQSRMREEEKAEFLASFTADPGETRVGLCVLGGIFGEGIDLKEDRLIGAVLVGTGLPLVCGERELFRRYFEQQGKDGFSYAYRYPGMNKVLQAGGRVIRTAKDRGAVLLLDDRFFLPEYQALFPREWLPLIRVNQKKLPGVLAAFWGEDAL